MLEKASKVDLVFFMLRNGGASHPFKISTTELSNELGISQQSASRWLLELEKEGMVERTRGGLKLTRYCIARCRTLYWLLKTVFEMQKAMHIEGIVKRGVGDGRLYISMPEYRKQLQRHLGFTPFEGTLNIGITEASKKTQLISTKGIEIDGFFSGGRTLGAAKCFRCVINGKVKGAVIIPLRSHYGSDVLELIAPSNLRKKLRLKDGSRAWADIELAAD
jgi:riboflavin kinase